MGNARFFSFFHQKENLENLIPNACLCVFVMNCCGGFMARARSKDFVASRTGLHSFLQESCKNVQIFYVTPVDLHLSV